MEAVDTTNGGGFYVVEAVKGVFYVIEAGDDVFDVFDPLEASYGGFNNMEAVEAMEAMEAVDMTSGGGFYAVEAVQTTGEDVFAVKTIYGVLSPLERLARARLTTGNHGGGDGQPGAGGARTPLGAGGGVGGRETGGAGGLVHTTNSVNAKGESGPSIIASSSNEACFHRRSHQGVSQLPCYIEDLVSEAFKSWRGRKYGVT